MHDKVVISDEMYLKAKTLGVENPKLELRDMVRLAARVTHLLGNYRYEKFVFNIIDKTLNDISLFYSRQAECPELHVLEDYKDGTLLIVCPDCEDDGSFCSTCNGKGSICGSPETLRTLTH